MEKNIFRKVDIDNIVGPAFVMVNNTTRQSTAGMKKGRKKNKNANNSTSKTEIFEENAIGNSSEILSILPKEECMRL